MTQLSLGAISPDTAPLTLSVPRPREEPPASLEPSTLVAAGGPAAALPRHQPTWWPVVLDTWLAATIACVAAALGTLSSGVLVTATVAWPLLLLAAGHYRNPALGESRALRVRLVLAAGLRAAILALALSPWLTTVDLVALAEVVAAFSVASGMHSLVGVRRRRTRLVLAGRPRDVREAMAELAIANTHEVVAVCLTRRSKTPIDGVATYVGFDTSSEVALDHGADAFIVLPGARLALAEMRRLHWALASVGAELCVGTGLLDVAPPRTRVLATGGLTFVHAVPPSLTGPRRWVKEVVERLAAGLGLVLLLPVLLVIGFLVRLDTPGPAIHRQHRVGREGRVFTMYKFRSMTVTAEADRVGLVTCNEADGVLFKIQKDPRITRFGRWLRRTSADELPQLWNVVRGEMSLVGPRPALPQEVAKYDADPRRRLVVKPGMTGLWQVSGRSDLSWAESVRIDARYVDNWSLRLDLAILVRTVRAVVGHRGAY